MINIMLEMLKTGEISHSSAPYYLHYMYYFSAISSVGQLYVAQHLAI